jgi:hypothetical protein
MYKLKNLTIKQKMIIFLLSTPLLLSLILTYFSGIKVVEGYNNPKIAISQRTSSNILDKIDRNYHERFGDVQAFAYNTDKFIELLFFFEIHQLICLWFIKNLFFFVIICRTS